MGGPAEWGWGGVVYVMCMMCVGDGLKFFGVASLLYLDVLNMDRLLVYKINTGLQYMHTHMHARTHTVQGNRLFIIF